MGLIFERYHRATKSILSKSFLRFIFCTKMKSERAPEINRRLNVRVPSEKLNFTKHLVGFWRDLEDNRFPAPAKRVQPRDGTRRDQKAAPPAKIPPGRPWLAFLFMLLANYLLMSFLFPSPEAPFVPYTFRANALCGSGGPQFFDGTSVTPGHEATGTVVAAGPGTRTPVGTTGAVFLMDFCGECRSCRLGYTNQCLQKRGDMGFNLDGGYGQYELVHENIFFPVSGEFSPTEATLLLDVMGTGGHAIERCHLMRPDIESLLVVGAGPIGLAVLAMAKIVIGQQLKVLIADVVSYRVKLAERLGGLPINVRETSLSAGIQSHGLVQVDMAVDTSGKQVAREAAVDAIAQRGSLICVGHGEGITLKISPDIIAPERSIVGSEYFRNKELP